MVDYSEVRAAMPARYEPGTRTGALPEKATISLKAVVEL